MKKTYITIAEEPPVILNDIIIHPSRLEAIRGQESIRLRKKECELLQFLARNPNKVINKNFLLEYIWNYDLQANSKTLEVHMSNLRRKIDGKYTKKLIQTVHGTGYKLSDEVDKKNDSEQLQLF